jgi:hypothetical protein
MGAERRVVHCAPRVLRGLAPLLCPSRTRRPAYGKARVNKAPELNVSGALSAMTLLAGFLLISTNKRRCPARLDGNGLLAVKDSEGAPR